jgi:hyperosmotically inducible protein
MKRTMSQIAVLTILMIVAVGCRTLTGQSAGTNVDNTVTTAAVKARLSADQLQNLTWVDVDTNGDTVYLSGTASSAEQKARATEIARSVEGVSRVVNNIQVQPRAPTAAAAPAPSASPATSGFRGVHTMTGEITSVNRANGHVGLKTAEGDMMLHFPPTAVSALERGDRVTVELGIKPAP